MVRGRGYARRSPTSRASSSRPARAGRPSASATSARWWSGPTCAAASRTWTAWARWSRHRRHAPGRERPRRDRPREGEAREIEPGLPPAWRSSRSTTAELIRAPSSNVCATLIEMSSSRVFIVLLFLWHVPSALIPIITIPVAVLLAFIPMYLAATRRWWGPTTRRSGIRSAGDLPGLRAGLPPRAAPPEDGHVIAAALAGWRRCPGLLQARVGVHAAAQRGLDPLHADHLPGISVARRSADADAGPHPEVFPEVERVFGKAGPRRDVHRPGAVLDDGDHHHPEAAGRVAPGALVLGPGARAGAAAAAADLAGPHLLRGAGRRDGPRAAHPRHPQRLDDADQGADRHAVDGRAHAGRVKVLGPDLAADRARRRAARGSAARSPAPQRLRRAGGGRAVRGLRIAARCSWPGTA
jgi:hypothetical protein